MGKPVDRTIALDDETWKALRIRAIEQNTSATALVRKAIEQFLQFGLWVERAESMPDGSFRVWVHYEGGMPK